MASSKTQGSRCLGSSSPVSGPVRPGVKVKHGKLGRLTGWLQVATLACVAGVPMLASAELSNETLLGIGLRSRPAYDGSASQHAELVPVLRYFGKTWFARSTQGLLEGGLRVQLLPGLYAGTQVAYESGRQRSESDFLERYNIASTERGASVGVHMEWDHQIGPMPISLLARVRKQPGPGVQADLRLSAGLFQSGRLSLGAYAQTSWADSKAANALYGIAPQQSASMGLPAFEPGSGLTYAGLGLLGSFELSPKWVVVGSLEARRTTGSVSNSPLVERDANHYLSLGLAYRY